MIQLGLQRISRLVGTHRIHHVHVAGTNGKGSICGYLSAALTATGIRVGKFTSPHLIHKHDCITINDKPLPLGQFDLATQAVEEKNAELDIKATPFEILAATAFKIFDDARCHAAVIECGMGGLTDATNVYSPGYKRVSVISKVGLDHQEFLGRTLDDITMNKCGIFRAKVPVVFDASNEAAVLRVIRQEVWKADAYVCYPWDNSKFATGPLPEDYAEDKVAAQLRQSSHLTNAPYQLANAEIAFRAAYTFLDQMQFHLPGIGTPEFMQNPSKRRSLLAEQPNPQILLDAIKKTQIPGRFQTVNLSSILGGLNRSITLDGAHNPQAIQALLPALEAMRNASPGGRMAWVVAFSENKLLDEMLAPLVRPGDYVAACSFGAVDGMPWKRAMPSSDIVDCLDGLERVGLKVHARDFGTDVGRALQWATGGLGVPTVGIGSLYLVSDILRLLESKGK